MRQIIFTITLVVFLCALLAGTNFETAPAEIKITPKGCGYTIIEAGKGLNCNGDTILINRIHPEIAAL